MKQKIMIIDDNKFILEVMGVFFEEAGFAVVKRDQSLGTSAAVYEEQPDCVLLDVNMPTLSGDELVGMIKENNKKTIKVFLFSEQDEWSLKKLVDKTGADGFFKKGTSKEEMLRVVQKSLERW